MEISSLQLSIDRPHLGRVEVAASVGKPDIAALYNCCSKGALWE